MIFLYAFFNLCVYISLFLLLFCTIMFYSYFKKRKKSCLILGVVCTLCFACCSIIVFKEHEGDRFWDNKVYGVMEGVFMENKDGHDFIYNPDGVLSIGEYTGSIDYNGGHVGIDSVQDFCVTTNSIGDHGYLRSGDVVKVLVKKSVDSFFSKFFYGKRTIEDFARSPVYKHVWNDVIVFKCGRLEKSEFEECVAMMRNDDYISCYIPGYGNYSYGLVPADDVRSSYD